MSLEALDTGIYNKLVAGTALISELGGTAIYNKRAPQEPGSKYVVFNWQGGGDLNESPTRMRECVYAVQGIATTNAAAVAIDDQLDALLHKQTLTVSGYTNIWTAREGDISYVEDDAGGVPRYHAGGLYRVIIDS